MTDTAAADLPPETPVAFRFGVSPVNGKVVTTSQDEHGTTLVTIEYMSGSLYPKQITRTAANVERIYADRA